jgi:cysteine desulfurase/selenocysteine lyase
VAAYEHDLLAHATQALLTAVPNARIIGQAKEKIAVLSFVVPGAHHQDIGILLDNYGIAVRTGHHCTQPVMDRLGISGTVRASFSFYNTLAEVDYFAEKLRKVVKMVA